MRTLASGIYAADEVLAVLRSRDYAYRWRFDLLDRTNAKTGELAGVEDHTIAVNVDQAVKGSLSLNMLPAEELRGQLLQARIRPVLEIRMPDRGFAEFTEGIYLWVDPEEEIELALAAGIDPSEWDVTLFDLTHRLELAGPTTGYTIPSGTVVTDAIGAIFTLLGFTDLSGIVASTATLPNALTWDLTSKYSGFIPSLADAGKKTDNKRKNRIRRKRRRRTRRREGFVENQPVKWIDILTTLCERIGYYSPHVDLDGNPRIIPQPDLTTAPAGVEYQTGDGFLQRMSTNRDSDSFANYVTVKTSGTGDFFGVAYADADVLVPGHPGSKTVLGETVSKVETNAVAGSMTELQADADALCLSSLSIYQTVSYDHLCNPAHEFFDVIAIGWRDHPEFDALPKFHERTWRMNRDLTMSGEARRLVEVT